MNKEAIKMMSVATMVSSAMTYGHEIAWNKQKMIEAKTEKEKNKYALEMAKCQEILNMMYEEALTR